MERKSIYKLVKTSERTSLTRVIHAIVDQYGGALVHKFIVELSSLPSKNTLAMDEVLRLHRSLGKKFGWVFNFAYWPVSVKQTEGKLKTIYHLVLATNGSEDISAERAEGYIRKALLKHVTPRSLQIRICDAPVYESEIMGRGMYLFWCDETLPVALWWVKREEKEE